VSRSTVVLLLAFALVSCGGAGTETALEISVVKTSIDSLWTMYATASDQRDAIAFASLFTDDAALMYSNAPNVNGKQAIGEFLAKLYTPIDATGLRVVPEDLKVSGSLAAQRGTFEERFIAENTEKTEYGRFALVAERGQDKSWRIRSLAAVVDSVR
jgi:uncharacterized protein (TIGR02246 family)